MTPEEKARKKIDKWLNDAGWDIVPRDEYVPHNALAVEEMLMQGNKESDYLLFVDDKAIAVLEAKREENSLGGDVAEQAELPASITLVLARSGPYPYCSRLWKSRNTSLNE